MASLTPQLQHVVDFLEKAAPEARVRSAKGKTIILESQIDRAVIKEKIEKYLSEVGLKHQSELIQSVSSFPTTKISEYDIRVGYKNAAGGMTETTLNSTITELFPCIAFLNGIKPNSDLKAFYSDILKHNKEDLPCYVGNDGKKGKEFVNKAESSTKFKEKMNGALGVLKFIMMQNSGKPIRNIFWGYRNKPAGINSSHKGDIFIQFTDGKMLGVSIKSGSENSAEPQLNTFVKPVMERMGMKTEYESMEKEAYDLFYADIPNIPNSYTKFGSREFVKAVGDFETSNKEEYDKKYDALLKYVKNKLMQVFSKDPDKTKKWILNYITGEQENVPLVIVKTIESSGSYEIKKDSDVVKACVMRSKKQNGLIVKDGSNKQDFSLNLACNAKTTTLRFSVRTNKPGVFHKLNQGINLAVKFNGIKK